MKTEYMLRSVGVLLSLGIIYSYATLLNGFLLLTQQDIIVILIGLAELLRWVLGLMAAILLIALQPLAKWLLLFSFLSGFVASWVSYIPFAGKLLSVVGAQTLWVNFFTLQIPNLLVVILVFYLFNRYALVQTATREDMA